MSFQFAFTKMKGAHFEELAGAHLSLKWDVPRLAGYVVTQPQASVRSSRIGRPHGTHQMPRKLVESTRPGSSHDRVDHGMTKLSFKLLDTLVSRRIGHLSQESFESQFPKPNIWRTFPPLPLPAKTDHDQPPLRRVRWGLPARKASLSPSPD